MHYVNQGVERFKAMQKLVMKQKCLFNQISKTAFEFLNVTVMYKIIKNKNQQHILILIC